MEVEMRRLARTQFSRMAGWDYDDPRFFEIKYEDMIGQEPEVLRPLFKHYGWPEEHLDEIVVYADRFSFRNVANRPVGSGETQHHLRSGKVAQWRENYSPRLIELAHELLDDVLISTGYETSSDW